MNRKIISMVSLSLTFLIVACGSKESQPEASKVNLANMHQHIETLASDKFGGRGPLSPGEKLTIDYLAEQYKAIGLTGANDGSFFQAVPMSKLTPDQAMVLTIRILPFLSIDIKGSGKVLIKVDNSFLSRSDGM